MKQPYFYLATWLLAAFVSLQAAGGSQPNIIYILLDDLGYGDVQHLNPERSKIPTPRMDTLASEGMTFSDAHSGSAVCTPTRYGILTGRYSWRTYLQRGVLFGYGPPLISEDRLTVAGFLGDQGYNTACIGKWHLGLDLPTIDGKPAAKDDTEAGSNVDWKGVVGGGPVDLGFDYFYGISASLDMDPYIYIENDRFVGECTTQKDFRRLGPAHEDFEAVDVLPEIGRKTVEFIRGQSKDKPFFAYVAFTSPHTPILPSPEWQGKSEIGPYGDFVMQTDAVIGEIVDAIDEAGFGENTIIIVTSDNGCSKAADIEQMEAKGHFPSGHLRGSKADIWDGGHRVPFIVRWPAGVERGSTSDQTISLTDLIATCADLLDTELPGGAGEDSVSFLPALSGKAIASTRAGVIHHSITGHFAYRQGKWKLLLAKGSGGWTSPREPEVSADEPVGQLYNMEDDPGETTNLYEVYPEVVERLLKDLEADVRRGRSTAGPASANDVDEINLWKSGAPLAAIQRNDNWIILDVAKASKEQGALTWDFHVKQPWKYFVQIISSGEVAGAHAAVEMAGQKLSGSLQEDWLIDAGTVSQLAGLVSFERDGRHTLSIATDAPLALVRLIPHRESILGTAKFQPQWEAMHTSPQKQAAMKWFKEARFGMFIHWGLYSQAGGIWQGTRIDESPHPGPSVAEWLMFKMQIPRSEYAELANTFNPDRSFAQNIARLAKDAGMRYVVITAKHHDGFALFDSPSSDFDMVDATPYGADAIKELYDACLAEGLEFGVYYSHGHDWMDGTDGDYAEAKARRDALGIETRFNGKNLWDPSPNTFEHYLESKAYAQVAELVSLLPRLRVLWFDGEGLITEEQAFRFYKMIYDLNPGVLVNRRVGHGYGDYLDAGDNAIPSASAKLTKHWETCGTTNNSWGYKSYDDDWKSTKELLYWFIDIASKGGNYLLNIGPNGKGVVPEESAQRLTEVGDWLAVNGDAIYGTTRWSVVHEGQGETALAGTGHRAEKGFTRTFTSEDFWFTTKDNLVYAISLAPAAGLVRIRSLNTETGIIESVRLLGSDREIEMNQTPQGLELDLSGVETGEHGFVIEAALRS